MNNQDIIDNIKSHLSGDKEIDVPYLQMELDIYKKMNNEEVIYAIANLLFGYMDPSIKEKLDLKTHEVLNERRLEYETVVVLINNEKYEEAKEILIRHTNIYKKATYTKEQNFYDFDQMIEYYIFCENVKNAKKLHVRRYPEPVAYYMYQLATIYEKENDFENAIKALKEGLVFNPRCEYILQELIYLFDLTNNEELMYEASLESLKYAYTKEQLSYCYKMLSKYYSNKNSELSVALLNMSNSYINNNQISDIDKKLIVNNNIQYHISNIVETAIDEFIKYTKKLNDIESVMYLLFIASDIIENEEYVLISKQMEKILEERMNKNE
jgi:hypothetical protein